VGVAVYLCKLPGGTPLRYEACTPAAAAWAFVAQVQPRRGRIGIVVWQEAANSPTIAMSIDPSDDTPMGGRAAVPLTTGP
jgi:hypothetical protein